MPEPDTPASAASAPTFNPFPGLRAFEPDEDYLYFGREKQIDELLRRLGDTRFLSVVGTSGSGKSSLVRAGLVPSLYSGILTRAGSSWRVAIMRPGGDPMGNLAAALDDPAVLGSGADTGEAGRMIIESTLRASSLGLADCVGQALIPDLDNVLVVVDQFEELFRFKSTSRSSRDEAVAFVKLLLAAAESDAHLYVVLTMRSDFIGDCMELPGLPEAINQGQYLVPRMTRDELRLAIAAPVGVGGAEISPRLVSRLLNDIEDNRDQLPVLQHALMRMWSYWESHRGDQAILDLDHYEAVGAMKEALSRHAEETFQGLESDGDRKIAEHLFKALTDTDRDGRGVRRPVQIQEVCAIGEAAPSAVMRVVDRFRSPGRSFLMPPPTVPLAGDTVVDMSHESLMRNWSRLKGWSAAEAESAAMYRRLSEAAHWHSTGEGNLWGSPQLDIGLRWREVIHPTVAWAARYNPAFEQAMSFLDRSEKARAQELQKVREDERQREDALVKRRRLTQLLVVAGVVILALGVTYWDNQRAARQRARLQAVLSAPDPLVRALMLSELKSVGLDSELEVAQQVTRAVIPRALLRLPAGKWVGVAYGPDDSRIATVSDKGDFTWWPRDGRGDPRPGAAIRNSSKTAAAGDLTAVAFSNDGRNLAAGFRDGTVVTRPSDEGIDRSRVLGTREPAQAKPPRTVAVRSVAFSPDGGRIAAAYDDDRVGIWDLDDGGHLVLEAGGDPGAATITLGEKIVGLSRERVVSIGSDGRARLWNLRDGRPPKILSVDGDSLRSAGFSPDGRWVVCGSTANSVLVWTSDGQGERVTLSDRSVEAPNASFSPNGEWLVGAFADMTAQIWRSRVSPQGGFSAVARPIPLEGHGQALTAIAFSHGGDEVVTLSVDSTARVWPMEPGEPRVLGRHTARVESVAFSPDGTRVVSGSDDGTACVWSLDPSTAPIPLRDPEGQDGDWVRDAVFDPTGRQVLTATDGKSSYSLWDVARRTSRVYAQSSPVLSVAFDSSGARFVTTTREANSASVWTLGRGDPTLVVELKGHTSWVWDAGFDPAGTRVVTASQDHTAMVWSLFGKSPSGQAFLGHTDRVFSASFAPDGARVVTASADRTARIWLLDGTQQKILRHDDAVTHAEFSSNGAWVVTASSDRTARVWSARNGIEHLALPHESRVHAAAFSPGPTPGRDDPAYVATGSEDGSVRVWRLTFSEMVDYAKRASTACLTSDDRVSYLEESPEQASQRFEECERRFGRSPPAQ